MESLGLFAEKKESVRPCVVKMLVGYCVDTVLLEIFDVAALLGGSVGVRVVVASTPNVDAWLECDCACKLWEVLDFKMASFVVARELFSPGCWA